MDEMERQWKVIKMILFGIYASVVPYAMIIIYCMAGQPAQSSGNPDLFFAVLLCVVFLTVPGSGMVNRILLSEIRLNRSFDSQKITERKLSDVMDQIRIGLVVTAAFGESCALFGLVYAFVSKSHYLPWIFFAFIPVHFMITIAQFQKARKYFETLAGKLSM